MQEYKAELSKKRESTKLTTTKNPALGPKVLGKEAPAVATTVEELTRKVATMAKQLEELEGRQGPLLSPSVPAEAEFKPRAAVPTEAATEAAVLAEAEAKPKAAVHEHEVHPGEEERWHSFLESDHGTPGH